MWPLLLVGVVVLILIFLSRHQSLTVDARYSLGSDREGVEALSVKWSSEETDKEVVANFEYPSSVPRVEEHRFEVPPGTYAVRAVISYADDTSRVVEQTVNIEGDGTVEINLVSN